MNNQVKGRERYIETKDGERIIIKILHSNRKTIGITVDKDANVILRLPKWVSEKKGLEFAREKSDWIEEKILLQKDRKKQAQLMENEIRSNLSPEHERALKKRYIEAAHEYFPKRCDYYANILGVTYGRIRIAEQKTRWGSCSSRGTLSFNWKLMLAPMRVLDYVVVHELCHLIEMNHSPRFWALLESIMPEYKEYRKWLKENGNTLRLS